MSTTATSQSDGEQPEQHTASDLAVKVLMANGVEIGRASCRERV